MNLDGFITRRHGRDVLSYDLAVDAPRYGSFHPSPLGLALCVFTDLPADLDEGLAGLTAARRPPPHYRRVAAWLDSPASRGQWFCSHHIDNDVLSIGPALPSGRALSGYLRAFAGYRTVQTDSRRQTFLSDDGGCLVDFDWDSECLAVYFHATRAAIESFFAIPIPDPVEFNRDGSMMTECARCCQWGGGRFEDFRLLDERYRLLPHEWRQVQSWLARGATSAAEVLTAAETIERIEAMIVGRPE